MLACFLDLYRDISYIKIETFFSGKIMQNNPYFCILHDAF